MKIIFKNDPYIIDNTTTANELLERSRDNLVVLETNVLNIYSALVKKVDFPMSSSKHSHSLCTVPYLFGQNLSNSVKECLNELDTNLKRQNFLILRKIFRSYCNELSLQRVNILNRLLNKWLEKNMFPISFLRVLSSVASNDDINLERKILASFFKSHDFISSFYNPRLISLPKTIDELNDRKLWYFIGVCVGDGSLLGSNDTWRLQISDGSIHPEELNECKNFLEKVKFLVETKFRTKFPEKCVHKEEGNWYNLEIFDKWLVRFLNFFFGLPIGNKIGKLSTPKILSLMKNKEILEKHFWRGVFDTDGMVDRNSRNIMLASSDDNLIHECRQFLQKYGIDVEIKSKKDRKGNLYNLITIDSSFIKEFSIHIGNSHPFKQRILARHLQRPLKYYVLRDLNDKNLTTKGKFYLKILKNKDKRVTIPKTPSDELLRIAECVSITDWEKKRVILKTTNRNLINFNLKKSLEDFEKIFGLKPKFLSTRNMWYINSQLLNEFFRKFFIYDKPWKPISKEDAEKLIEDWNGVFDGK